MKKTSVPFLSIIAFGVLAFFGIKLIYKAFWVYNHESEIATIRAYQSAVHCHAFSILLLKDIESEYKKLPEDKIKELHRVIAVITSERDSIYDEIKEFVQPLDEIPQTISQLQEASQGMDTMYQKILAGENVDRAAYDKINKAFKDCNSRNREWAIDRDKEIERFDERI